MAEADPYASEVVDAPVQEDPDAADGESDPRFTADLGKTRGIKLEMAMLDDNDQYRPKPAAPKSAAKRATPPPVSHHRLERTHAVRVNARPHQHRERAHSPHRARMAERRTPEPAVEFSSLDLRINFEFNSMELTAEGISQSEELGKALEAMIRAEPSAKFLLIGHTDMVGGESYNLELSGNRAAAVRAYLIRRFPNLEGSLTAEGVGKRAPLFSAQDDEAQRLNRRVEVKKLN